MIRQRSGENEGSISMRLGKYVFYVGTAGAVLSGMFLDGRLWGAALISVIICTILAVIGYKTMDIDEVLDDLEPTVVKQAKEENREKTFRNWIQGTQMP